MRKVNDVLATWLTLGLGNMWTFYFCVVIGVTPMFIPAVEATLLYWSNFIQLIFLPVIIVGQDILGQSAKRQALEDHRRIKIILDKLLEDVKINGEELKMLKEIIEKK